MIVSLNDILPDAQIGQYAIPAFNTYNLELTQGIVAAAQVERSPIIIGVSESSIKYAGIIPIYEIIFSLADKLDIPTVLHLDHGHSIEIISEAIEVGFSSVMFDGSNLPFEENIKKTQEVVNLSHSYDVSVEGELGSIGGQEDKTRNQLNLTDPNQVYQFVESTDVDALAVSLGTSHGLPVSKEQIDFQLLAKIASITRVPLVLHGASNIESIVLKKATKEGIAKVNIDTQLRQAFTEGVREVLKDHKIYDPRKYLSQAKDKVKQEAKKIIRILESDNKI